MPNLAEPPVAWTDRVAASRAVRGVGRAVVCVLAALPVVSAAAETAALPERIEPTTAAVLPRVGDYHRAALHVDPVEAAIARRDWKAPAVGQTVVNAAGSATEWLADDGPRSGDFSGGYAYAEFESPAAGVMLLEAPGCAAVCINGEWVPGDPYGAAWFRLPVEVKEGANWLMTHLAAPSASPRLVKPDRSIEFLAEAATLPDLVAGRDEMVVLSLPLRNASVGPVEGARLRVKWQREASEPDVLEKEASDDDAIERPLRWIDALLLTPITIEAPAAPEGLAAGESATLLVELLPAKEGEPPIATASLKLRVVTPDAPRTDTFVSEIDGSVQPYGVLPATGEESEAVVVSLHDAGQSHDKRLAEHPPSEVAHVIAPGGRGRWGFDWEDWSRLDVLETLDDFQRRQKERGQPIDERRVSVIGQGMGGHGALRLATLQPDRFAAASIVDGWISFYTQGGAHVTPSGATPIARLLGRQASANDPLSVIENLRGSGVSVRYAGRSGVSPSEGRYLRQRLGEYHEDFSYREAPGQRADELLQQQVAWLASRRLVDAGGADEIDFATPDVAVAATLGWVTIASAETQGEVARVQLRRDLERNEVVGSTVNVARLRLSLGAFRGGTEVRLRLDGTRAVKFQPGRNGESVTLARDVEGEWRRVPNVTGRRFAGWFKDPERAGGFKSLFCCRPQLAYGTRGATLERSWAAAKARYDAHLFLYRGAGLLEVLPDRRLRQLWRDQQEAGRSVVLYGSAPTNAAWTILQQEAFFRRGRTLRLDRGRAWLDDRPESGDDLAVLAVRPRAGSERALIGLVGGTGLTGMRMTTRLRYFWSGIEYPDFLLYGPATLDTPSDPAAATDVRAAGYFDADWGVEGGGVLWRDLAI